MVYKCIIIDDDQYAIDAIARYISQMPNLAVGKTFTSPVEALQSINRGDDATFIFLDIEMPGISGLELATQLRGLTKFLIFTTSHSKHALEAFQVMANQYLLKPITFANFAFVVNHFLESQAIANQTVNEPPRLLQFIKADQKNSFHQIAINDIQYIKGAKNYVIIYTETSYFMTHSGLNQMEAALPDTHFIRISKSFIVSKNAIKKIQGNLVKLNSGEGLQIGGVYKAKFLDFVKANMINPTDL